MDAVPGAARAREPRERRQASSKTVTVTISRLRRKLDAPDVIDTIPRAGYWMMRQLDASRPQLRLNRVTARVVLRKCRRRDELAEPERHTRNRKTPDVRQARCCPKLDTTDVLLIRYQVGVP
jgi:DNA-binding winged helix-turn-helix (wHTH) protein